MMDTMATAMFSQAAWQRTLEVRERFLATGGPGELPPEDCDITADDLPAGYARAGHLTALERAERQALTTALREANGDREAAARDLGISRATIYRKLTRLKVTVPPGHGGPATERGAR